MLHYQLRYQLEWAIIITNGMLANWWLKWKTTPKAHDITHSCATIQLLARTLMSLTHDKNPRKTHTLIPWDSSAGWIHQNQGLKLKYMQWNMQDFLTHFWAQMFHLTCSSLLLIFLHYLVLAPSMNAEKLISLTRSRPIRIVCTECYCT